MGYLLVASANNHLGGTFLLCRSRINTALEADIGPPQFHLSIIFLCDSVL